VTELAEPPPEIAVDRRILSSQHLSDGFRMILIRHNREGYRLHMTGHGGSTLTK